MHWQFGIAIYLQEYYTNSMNVQHQNSEYVI